MKHYLTWALLLILACYFTGEPPKWQWDIPESPNVHENLTAGQSSLNY